MNPRLLTLAGARRGVFTAMEARQYGHTIDELQMLRRRGDITSLRRGIYTLTAPFAEAAELEQHAVRVAALGLALSAPAVLSHQSAAAEHGIALLDPDRSLLHVTRPEGDGSREEAGVRHHAAEVPAEHVVRRDGLIDLTTPARTAVDVARSANRLACAVAAYDSVLRMGVSATELREVFLRCRTWPGARMAGGALGLADGRAANPGESWARVLLIEHGVGPTDLQVRLEDEDGLIGYADFGWDGVVGELDGKVKYRIGADSDPEQAARIVWAEKVREDRIRRLGREVVRWTIADHYRPAALAGRVLRALARAEERRRHSG